MKLKNKVIVITGATGGIGREIVKRLDNEGATLILVSRTETELSNLLKSLENKESKYYVSDFSDQEKTVKTAKEIQSDFSKIDVLINATGIGIYKPIELATLDEWNKTINIGLTSTFVFIKELMPSLNTSEDSLVLTIGSGAGVIPMSGRSLYCAMKFGLRGFILSLAEEFKRIGNPKFCLITLGSTLTSFGPMSFEEKKKDMESGKAYFTPEWVGDKLVEIIKDTDREVEYTLYPGDYGFGEWNKPEPK
ncbi:MAG: SDR family NAD(P)-dependent oxidoreductase [bacterium]|nr:MAG: SDR family NAD(P)-dependent oxidoreductase [bacterium]